MLCVCLCEWPSLFCRFCYVIYVFLLLLVCVSALSFLLCVIAFCVCFVFACVCFYHVIDVSLFGGVLLLFVFRSRVFVVFCSCLPFFVSFLLCCVLRLRPCMLVSVVGLFCMFARVSFVLACLCCFVFLCSGCSCYCWFVSCVRVVVFVSVPFFIVC